jgi:hypothetical protein
MTAAIGGCHLLQSDKTKHLKRKPEKSLLAFSLGNVRRYRHVLARQRIIRMHYFCAFLDPKRSMTYAELPRIFKLNPVCKIVRTHYMLHMGHSQISMTMDIYSHVLPTMQQEAIGKLNIVLEG